MTGGAREALIAQILESPDDEAPRRVYADWLEEQGDPLAEVVRLQLDGGPDAEPRIAALVETHRARWFEPIAPWGYPIANSPAFDRGILHTIYGPAGKYAQAATQKLLLPVLKNFGAASTMITGQAKRLAACATLAWTHELWWWDCQLEDASLRALAESPHLARLTSLTLEKTRCSNAGLAALARSPHLGRLRHLGLRAPVHMGKFDADGVLAVLEQLPITSLALDELNRVDGATLGNAPAARRLRTLSLHTSRVHGLATSSGLTNLRELHLDWLTPNFADLEPLFDNPAFARLERLTVRSYAPIPAELAARIEARYPRR